jgi:Lysyl oxidase/WD40-like Beta Propeller Repeat
LSRRAVGLVSLTLLAAGLAAATLSVAGAGTTRLPASWATLAFARSETAGGGVFLVGRNGARLIARGAHEPAWSPDGRRLAFVALGAGGAGDVFVKDADGTHPGRITSTEGVHEASPSWSPDGLRLAFEREGTIVVARADSSRARALTRGWSPAWSPGGARIAYERDGDLFLVPASGGRPVRLTATPAAESSPAWAPDGRRLAYVSDETGMPDIRVLDTRSRAATPLTADAAFDSSPAFSADGRRIVFVSNRGGAEALWRVPARGGAASPVGGPPFVADAEPRPVPLTAELLPDLDQQPPQDLDVRTSGRRYLLWFTSAADNVGLGPFIVNGRRPSADRLMRANQRVRLANGRLRTYPEIGVWRYNHSIDHSHWHLLHFQRYELRGADGSVVVRDRKSGFCIGDRYGIAANRVDGFKSRPVYRGFCNLYQPSARQVDGGTSVGYSDRYHSRLDGQNVDITRVPAGEYVLVNRANPELLIRELRYENNAGSVRIRIGWPNGRRAQPSVHILKRCPDSESCD